MTCYECLNKYGGEERRCPGTCRFVGHSDIAGDWERDMRGFVGEPRFASDAGLASTGDTVVIARCR
jgi:hypothetical protein